MKIVEIKPIAVSVELTIPDCIALFVACVYACDDGVADIDYNLTEALGNALLGQALAAHAIEQGDPPHTIAGMWEKWAPYSTQWKAIRRIAMPDWLPLSRGES
jgi:hypothetical protein